MSLPALTDEHISLDQNVANNILDLAQFGKEDVQLIKSLIFYFSFSFQNDIFLFGTLDPYDFAQKFNYQPGHLRKRHKNPEQLKNLSKQQIDELYKLEKEDPSQRVFDSILENALWLLGNKTIHLQKGKKLPNNSEHQYSSSVKFIKFLDDFSVYFNRKSNYADKVLYTYSLTPMFAENLSSLYFNAKPKSLIRLRKPKLDDLYIYLTNLKSILQLKGLKTTSDVHFEYLCKLANIKITEPKDRKKKFNKVFKTIQERSELKVSLSWIKGPNMSYAYQPLIEFDSTTNISSSSEQEKLTKFDNLLKHSLTKVFERLHPDFVQHNNYKQNILRWITSDLVQSHGQNINAVKGAYIYTHQVIFQKKLEPFDNHVVYFHKSLKDIKSLQENWSHRHLNTSID